MDKIYGTADGSRGKCERRPAIKLPVKTCYETGWTGYNVFM